MAVALAVMLMLSYALEQPSTQEAQATGYYVQVHVLGWGSLTQYAG